MMANITWYRRRLMTPVNMLFCWHLGLTLMLAWWAAILAYPESTFSVSRSYAEFNRICPDERFWAVGYAFAASWGALGCCTAWPPRLRRGSVSGGGLRMLSAIIIAAVHGITAVLMLKGAPTGTGSGMYALIMCSACLLLRAEYERS